MCHVPLNKDVQLITQNRTSQITRVRAIAVKVLMFKGYDLTPESVFKQIKVLKNHVSMDHWLF